MIFFFSSRRRHTRWPRDWSSDVCSSDLFTDGVNNRYGTTTSAADYARKAELQNYENARAFFEAWTAHEFTQSFGAIFWMLNGVWPSVHWNLYDWYYEPGGGYFGAKKANEAVHI